MTKLIGFQGERGAYSEIAAKEYDSSAKLLPFVNFVDVFEGVENGKLDLGIVPIENSLEGPVTTVNDLLVETNLKIVGEIKIQIRHNLLVLQGVNFEQVHCVYSHPQALAQCRDFLIKNNLEQRPYYDTAGSAKMLFETKQETASVIASKLSAKLYNLKILKENIADNEFNKTRFVVLSKKFAEEQGNKCSIIFCTHHKTGALFSVLKIFAEANVNLTRIESRPIRKKPNEFAFFLDFQGCDKDKKIIGLLDEVKNETLMFKFLGCYKEWTE
ncbi:prephenate dehydratase [Candidatus Woesearchaeota archaeon CG10_big_fil_rev_8_21_14_0_10_30_7]|nr:MAG: prephenate dehydratase [Candidatus Woesearchaeota archaeon CG10_big_fil_rev_8_21_14_0_10_30_7]